MQLTEVPKEVPAIHSFYWSPEGRKLATYIGTIKQVRAQFKKEFPAYAKFMGEVYRTSSPLPQLEMKK